YNLIIITDDEDIDGFEVAGALMSGNLTVNYAIILVSSVDVRGNYLKCINLGVDHYLVKPVDEEELYEAIAGCFPAVMAASHTDHKAVATGLDILVVDDNQMNSRVIGTMLESLGYSPDFAVNGKEACKMAGDKDYDIIFMDLIMPEMDGYEASKKILSKNKSLVIAAFTADNMPESRKRAELSGIREFISKPVRIDHLKSVLRKYFGDY
ncbi:MAG: response regulator, partial [Bacteroidales bacterium]|nr:response regulator [Bacteroidales bacterium]